MCVAVIGGMARLEQHYRQEATEAGIELRVFNRPETGIAAKLKHVDALLIFTNKVSHRARREAISVARSRDIPVFQAHSCGVCSLRNCLNGIKII